MLVIGSFKKGLKVHFLLIKNFTEKFFFTCNLIGMYENKNSDSEL